MLAMAVEKQHCGGDQQALAELVGSAGSAGPAELVGFAVLAGPVEARVSAVQ